MRRLLSSSAFALALMVPGAAKAQLAESPAPVPAPVVAVDAAAPTSLVAAGRVALAEARTDATAAMPSMKGGSFGRPEALMLIGGAAIIGGMLVGGDVGYVVSVVGLGVGLYGLWEYLK